MHEGFVHIIQGRKALCDLETTCFVATFFVKLANPKPQFSQTVAGSRRAVSGLADWSMEDCREELTGQGPFATGSEGCVGFPPLTQARFQ